MHARTSNSYSVAGANDRTTVLVESVDETFVPFWKRVYVTTFPLATAGGDHDTRNSDEPIASTLVPVITEGTPSVVNTETHGPVMLPTVFVDVIRIEYNVL